MSGSFKNPTKIDTKMSANDYINSKKTNNYFVILIIQNQTFIRPVVVNYHKQKTIALFLQ